MKEICRHYFIEGKVQGVWYRASTQEKAIELKLTGWVKNLSDGRVEAMACGEQEKITAFEKWLWEGSELANVSNIIIEEKEIQEFNEFNIEY